MEEGCCIGLVRRFNGISLAVVAQMVTSTWSTGTFSQTQKLFISVALLQSTSMTRRTASTAAGTCGSGEAHAGETSWHSKVFMRSNIRSPVSICGSLESKPVKVYSIIEKTRILVLVILICPGCRGMPHVRKGTCETPRPASGSCVGVGARVGTFPQVGMVYVPAGLFTMGARDNGADGIYARDDEFPRHRVALSAYEIGKYEVTNAQFCEVLNWAKGRRYLEDSERENYTGGSVYRDGKELLYVGGSKCQIDYGDGEFISGSRDGYSMGNHPVVYVSWYGAAAFCNWLSEMQSLIPCYDLDTWRLRTPYANGYRLPTEAEWERAAAWGKSEEWWKGAKHWIYGYTNDAAPAGERCNAPFLDSEGARDLLNPIALFDLPYTSPVGWFNGVNISPKGEVQTLDSPSPVGCYDMSGNVAEWCYDWYGPDQSGAVADKEHVTRMPWNWYGSYTRKAQRDPVGALTGTWRVVRGGSFWGPAYHCRTAFRGNSYPEKCESDVGFRTARSPQS